MNNTTACPAGDANALGWARQDVFILNTILPLSLPKGSHPMLFLKGLSSLKRNRNTKEMEHQDRGNEEAILLWLT